MTAGVLDGLRVIEGSAFVAAPSGGMTLAQMGADVIRFDQIGGGLDHLRWPLSPEGVSLYWHGLNKGKRSLAVDLRDREIQELLTGLITADGPDRGIFLTNFAPAGWMAYERLREARDDLIMVNVTGNHDGSSAVDYTVNCAVGYPDITGPVDAITPVNSVLPAWDLVCGQTAALGVLGAERHRARTGQGQLVRLALSDVALAAVAALGNIAEVELTGARRARYGNDLYGAFGRDFATADARRVMVVAISKKQWRGLVEATGIADGVAELESREGLDLTTEADRFAARDEVAALMAPWFLARPLAAVAELLDRHGVCWGPYQTFDQLVAEDPRCSTANPLFARVDQPSVGTVLTPGSPLQFGAVEREHPPAPILGEHTDEILAEDLGLSSGAIAALHDRGAVAGPR